MRRSVAEIIREYGPFPGVDRVNGVTYDGRHVWFATGDALKAFDPANGNVEELQQLLVPAPDNLLTMHKVSTDVNNVRNKGAELIQPIEGSA